jgi:hypothetical protein
MENISILPVPAALTRNKRELQCGGGLLANAAQIPAMSTRASGFLSL